MARIYDYDASEALGDMPHEQAEIAAEFAAAREESTPNPEARKMSTSTKFRKGEKVVGLGRNGHPWKSRPTGTVTKCHGQWVRVQWDNCCVEDDMRPEELAR